MLKDQESYKLPHMFFAFIRLGKSLTADFTGIGSLPGVYSANKEQQENMHAVHFTFVKKIQF